MKDKTFDIVIVGGGPAGATAAILAGRRGLKTLLVDKERFPRDKTCGDALSGKSVGILRDIGLLDQVSRLPGATITAITFGSPDFTETRIDLSRPGSSEPMTGFVIRRRIFDQFLFEEAGKVCDRCIDGFGVQELLVEDGRVCGIRGTDRQTGRTSEFRGSIVLGADGFRSVVARRMGLYEHDTRHCVVALRCYYEGVSGLTDQIELHYLDEVRPGYFWIFPLEDGYANVGVGMLHSSIRSRKISLRAALASATQSPHFRRRFANARALETPSGWNLPVGSKHRRIHGDGFILLGDAAGLIDPFTGEGMGNAMLSAQCAVETARQACDSGDFSEGFLSVYDRHVWGLLRKELKVSTRLQQLGRLRFLVNLLIRKAAHNSGVRDTISGMIANEVPKQQLLNPLFYLSLLMR